MGTITNNGLQIMAFTSQKKWEHWLSQNYDSKDGIWLRLYKKASGIESINHDEALDEALCYGWIDAQAKSYDTESYLQRFVPRRPKSIWSKRNIEHIERLTKLGKMQPAGIKEYENAKADGRLDLAYDSPANMQIPDDFLKELARDKKAENFFKTLNKTNIYAITWRLQTAKKPETRIKRLKQILEMLNKEQKFH